MTNKLYGSNHQLRKLLFHFQTVFYCTHYSYRCCSCAFHHEFLDYIEENGSIKQDIYETIVQSIRTGKCPHVTDDVPRVVLQTTCVTGAHIRVAKGDDKPIKEDTDAIQFDDNDLIMQFRDRAFYRAFNGATGIFNRQLFHLALIRRKYLSARYYYERYQEKQVQLDEGHVLCCTKVGNNPDAFVVKKLSALVSFVHTRNEKLLKNILKFRSSYQFSSHQMVIEGAIKYTIKYGLINQMDIVLKHSEPLLPESRASCMTWAIMFNNSEALEKLLKYSLAKKSPFNTPPRWLESRLIPLFQAFNRPNCKTMLLKYGLLLENGTKSDFVREILLPLLNIEDFRSECFDALQKISDTEHLIGDRNIQWNPRMRRYELSNNSRAMLKLHILHNSDLEIDRYKNDVAMGLIHDHRNYHNFIFHNYGGFFQIGPQFLHKCDGKNHGRFVQDDVHFALNFLGPFMLECGFNTNKKVLEKSLDEMRLHPTENIYLLNYIQENFDRPTPLVKLCRRVLRRYFKGQSIHKFTEVSDCPKKIKNFILMKDHIFR